MSDHDAAPDPIDEAYVRAEAMLSDDEARAARRARVLDAVTPAPALAAAAPAPARRRAAWRPGGWLAAACVAGLSVFLAIKLFQPTQFQPQTTPAAPAASTTAGPTALTPTPPPLKVPASKSRAIAASPEPPAPAASPPEGLARPVPAAAPPIITPAPAPSENAPIAAPSPAAPVVAQTPRAFPAAAPPAPPVVASERIESAPAAKASDSSAGSDEAVADVRGGLSVPASRRATLAEAPVAGRESRSDSSAELPPELAARLRAAAAAGRTAEVEALLGQGAPVDAPDAAGDTALIKSLQADHPAAAAALRRHGASLDHKDLAGKSARDIVTTKGDPELNRAIGVGP